MSGGKTPKPYCIFHDNRVQFEAIVKCLRREKWLPKSYAAKMAMAVCSCRKKENIREGPWSAWTEEDIHQLQTRLQIRLEAIGDQQSNLKHLLYEILHNRLSSTNESQCKFIFIVDEAMKQNFLPLTMDETSGEAANEIPRKKKPEYRRLTFKEIECMNRRKEKVMLKAKETFEIRICPNYIGKLIGRKGENLKGIEQKYSCRIKLKRSNENMGRMIATVLSSSAEFVRTAKQELLKVAAKVQVEREDFFRRKREELISRAKQSLPWKDFRDLKEWNREEYHRQKTGSDKRNTLKAKISIGKTGDYRRRIMCRNCHFERRTDLPDNEDDVTTELGDNDDECTYHPGFKVGDVWSCCGSDVRLEEDICAEYRKVAGCVSGVHHWRRCRRRAGKSNVNTDKSYLPLGYRVTPKKASPNPADIKFGNFRGHSVHSISVMLSKM